MAKTVGPKEHDDDPDVHLQEYIDRIAAVIGHADRSVPLRAYCRGLATQGVRKSIERIAALSASEGGLSAVHQSLHHFISSSNWSDRKVLGVALEIALQVLADGDQPMSWILCDGGFVKKGKHTVGVARKYCARIGRRANCQSAVFLFLSTGNITLPITQRLYLPEPWAMDGLRRRRVGVPEGIRFQTRAEIALHQIEQAVIEGVPPGTVCAGTTYTYGDDQKFRESVTRLHLPYALGVRGAIKVRAVPDTAWSTDKDFVTAQALAARTPASLFRPLRWRHLNNWTRSRFAARRVLATPGRLDHAEWLLVEWPEGAREPQRYWLLTLPESSSLDHLVEMATRTWRGEACYRELKEAIGLGHYEGRGWKGYHHHATLCIAIYNSLVHLRRSRGIVSDPRTETDIVELAVTSEAA